MIHSDLGLICFGLGLTEKFLASASTLVSFFSGLINKPAIPTVDF